MCKTAYVSLSFSPYLTLTRNCVEGLTFAVEIAVFLLLKQIIPELDLHKFKRIYDFHSSI